MRIGGFAKQSLIDWDGKLCAVVFTKACNMRCFYCHNKSLAFPEFLNDCEDFNEIEILNYLNGRRGFLDAVVVGGGEPTMQPGLLGFLENLKSMKYLIKLDTNGTNPSVLGEALKRNLVDCVAMDVKTIVDYEKYSEISKGLAPELFENIRRSIEILKNSKIEYIFRTTVVEQLHTSAILSRLKKEFPQIIFQKCRI